MENYIVRIYRKSNDSGELFGTIERTDDERKRVFKNSEELWGILSQSAGRRVSGVNQEISLKRNRK